MSKIEFMGFSEEMEKGLRKELSERLKSEGEEFPNELYNTDLIRNTLCFHLFLNEEYMFLILANNELPNASIVVNYNGSIFEEEENECTNRTIIANTTVCADSIVNWRDIAPKILVAFHKEANRLGYQSNWEV